MQNEVNFAFCQAGHVGRRSPDQPIRPRKLNQHRIDMVSGRGGGEVGRMCGNGKFRHGDVVASEVVQSTGLVTTTGAVEIHPNEEEPEDEHNAEDVAEKRVLPTPNMPTRAEVERHRLDHIPYRSWCGACVSGRGRERPHARIQGAKRQYTLCFDYMFITKVGAYSREEWALQPEGTLGVKILVAREMVTKCVCLLT